MKTLTVGTTNEAKVKQIRGALLPLGIEVSGIDNIKLLPVIIEDGTTAQANARKKAITYAGALGKIVLSMDNALFIDGLNPEQQPGINVRRIGGRDDRPSDGELLEHYSSLISKLGQRINGHWEFAVCVANVKGEFKETTIISPRVFVARASSIILPGYPLESIQIEPESGKYISEMNQDEQNMFWQKAIGQQLCDFVRLVEL
jgi:inosine/xanthosine triphosphate pyrophosphatase family protein